MPNLIHISAFLRKEIAEILRQPRLLLTLILGPFLILLLFGIGYRNEAQTLRTMFVMDAENPFRAFVEEYTLNVSSVISFAGIVETEAEARAFLRANQIDAAIVLPEEPVEKIRRSEHPVFRVLHREIDPFMISYMRVFARVYADEVNNRVLAAVAQEGQRGTETLQAPLEGARTSASNLRTALENDNQTEAQAYQFALARSVGVLAVAAGSDQGFVTSVGQRFGSAENQETTAIGSTLARLQENTAQLSEINPEQGDKNAQIELVQTIEEDLDALETSFVDFSQIEPDVLVSPFVYTVESVTPVELALADFYVPAVIALLIQHIAVTFAAMSIVRERTEGSLELFRISPISSFETLVGKYGSYFLFDTVIAVILTGLIIMALGSPMVGSWLHYTITLGLLIFTSLGMGFTVSLMARTTTQAVQYSMIILLASIFFSGFFLGLSLLWEPVRIVSWLLPATYTTELLQNIMLRGQFDGDGLIRGLALLGAAFFMLSWLLLRRLMRQR